MDEETEEVFTMLEECIDILDTFMSKAESAERDFQTFEVDVITDIHTAACKLRG